MKSRFVCSTKIHDHYSKLSSKYYHFEIPVWSNPSESYYLLPSVSRLRSPSLRHRNVNLCILFAFCSLKFRHTAFWFRDCLREHFVEGGLVGGQSSFTLHGDNAVCSPLRISSIFLSDFSLSPFFCRDSARKKRQGASRASAILLCWPYKYKGKNSIFLPLFPHLLILQIIKKSLPCPQHPRTSSS